MKRLLAALALTVSLSACKNEEAAQAPAAAAKSGPLTSPVTAVENQIKSLREGRVSDLILSSVPAADLEKMRQKWRTDMDADPATDTERAEFLEAVTELTAQGAEEAIFAKLEPELDAMREQAAMQLPMYVGMGRGMLVSAVQQREDLNEAQKQQAVSAIDAFAKWAESAKFTDAELARKAIGHVCAAARQLKLESLDQARALSFDDMLKKGDIAFVAVKNIFTDYGFPVDETLASMKTELVSESDDSAKVKVSYTLLGTPLSMESDMVRVDGQWFSKNTIDELKKQAETPAADAPAEDGAEESEAPESAG